MRAARATIWLRICLLAAALTAGSHAAWALSVAADGTAPPWGDNTTAHHTGFAVNRASSPLADLEGPLCPLEVLLFADAADGWLDEHSLLVAALVASGVDSAETIRRYQRRLAELVDRLRRSGTLTGSRRRQARAIFEFMHRNILHAGYQIDCTDLTLALDEGRFNCVSASVLFCCLADRFGLQVRGLEIPGHAMSCLILPECRLEVESTCADWFRLIDDPEKQAELVRRTIGFRRGGKPSPGECREVSGAELVATIYYNRGVDLLARKQYARALAANAKALRLDPSSKTAHGNLLATLNNWAIELGSEGRYAEAIGLLQKGFSLQPDFEAFWVNYRHVSHQWIEYLCNNGRFREALSVLAAAEQQCPEQQCPDQPWFTRTRLDIYRRWAAARGTAKTLPAFCGSPKAGAHAKRSPTSH